LDWNSSSIEAKRAIALDGSNVYFMPLNHFLAIENRFSGPFNGGPQVAALYFGLGFALALICRQRSIAIPTIIFSITLGSTTGSRTFYIIVLVSFFVWLASNLKLKLSKFQRLTIIVALLSCIYFVINFYLNRNETVSQNIQNLTGRRQLWQFVVSHLNILGHGPNSLLMATTNDPNMTMGYGQAHNDLLQVFWSYGLFGFTSLVLFYCLLIRYSSKSLNAKSEHFLMLAALISVQTEICFLPSTSLPIGCYWLALISSVNSSQKATKFSS
jgi:hypothetical protein